MRIRARFVLLALTSSLSGLACFATQPVKTDGPVRSEGVVVSVIDEDCWDENDEPRYTTEDSTIEPNALDVRLQIEVDNAGSGPVSVDPAPVRLIVGDDTVAPLRAVPPIGVEDVAPGGRRKLELNFHRAGHLPCGGKLQLAISGLVRSGTHVVALHPVNFEATHN